MPEAIETPDRAPRWPIIAAVSVLLIATVAAYHNSFSVPELLDDPSAISSNPTLIRLGAIGEVLNPPAESGLGGRPLANLTFALNYAWSGPNLRSYHFVNLLIHAAASLALFGIVRRTLLNGPTNRASLAIGKSDSTAIALTIAALWSLHPVLTNSVTYLSQRTESMMGACYLVSLYAFIRATEARAHGAWRFVSVAACFAGMATKEVMASAPLVIFLYDRTFVAGTFRDAWRKRRGYYAALAASWLLLAWLVTTGLKQRNVGFGLGVEWWRYALTESRALLIYLRVGLWPHPLVFDYGPDFLGWAAALPYLGTIAILVFLTLRALQRNPVAGFIAACPFLLLAPTSSVVPVALQPVAENRIYLPLVALVSAVALGFYRIAGRRGLAALAALGIAFAWLAEQRNETYQSELRLWADTIAKRPSNPRAHDNYAQALRDAGRLDEALAQLLIALGLNPKSHSTNGELGGVYMALGRLDEGIAHYRRALELKPDVAIFHNNLATGLARTNHLDEAFQHYTEAVRLDPGLAAAQTNLGGLLYQQGRMNEAIAHYQKALEFAPGDIKTRYNLGLAFLQLGRNAEAIACFQNAVEKNPGETNWRNTYGVALMRAGRLREAESQFDQLLRTDPQNPQGRENLQTVQKTLATQPAAAK